ncbi:hypothetical protein D3C80_1942090 [compost metagenome]
MDMQIAEARGEGRLLLGLQRLVAEEQHLVGKKRLFDGLLRGIVQRTGEVDAGYHGAQCRAEGFDGDGGHLGVLVLNSGAGLPSPLPSPGGRGG